MSTILSVSISSEGAEMSRQDRARVATGEERETGVRIEKVGVGRERVGGLKRRRVEIGNPTVPAE